MRITRRDVLTWGGGVTAGLVASPVPWRLLRDASTWTQNWPWIPQPVRAAVEVKSTFCSLCPHGCGMRVRMAAGAAVGVAGMPQHPVNAGALCPLAFGAHQLNRHPARVVRVERQGRSASWSDAMAAFQRACAEGPVAVVDGYAGRAASAVFADFAKRQGGSYCSLPTAEERALAPYAQWSGGGTFGYDLEGARTVVSFGAPLLDGWGPPGRVGRLWTAGLRLIQIESALSRTGNGAWRRVPIREGGEAALAAGLARVMIEERLVAAQGPIPPLTVAESAALSGVTVEEVQELARTIAAGRPAVAIASDGDPAIAALNVVMGAVGSRGGIVRRTTATPVRELAGSFRAVLVDASAPWDYQTPASAEVFRFAAWQGPDNRVDWLLPAPGFLEELTDIPTAPGSSRETYAVAPALVAPLPETRSAAQFLREVRPELKSVADIVDERRRKFGVGDGAVWVGEAPRFETLRCRLAEWPQSTVPRRSTDWAGNWRPAVLPPLATKLYRESSLRETPARRIA